MRSIASCRTVIFAVAVVALVLSTMRASASELLMFEEKWCHWCQQWNEEIGVIYQKTDEGRRAPLRRVDIHDGLPGDVALVSRPQYSPTFVLIDNGREIGRIEGYPGEDFFWGLLERLLERLPEKHTSARGTIRPAVY